MHGIIVLLFGAPGVGKGTQALKISKNTGLVHISTGDLLREAVREDNGLGKKARTFMERGELVPDNLVVDIILEKMKFSDGERGFLLDGFPRNISQAVTLMEILKSRNEKIDLALDIEVDHHDLINRLTSRRVCKECGRIFNLQTKPSIKEGICDFCGGKLYQRTDDTEETVKTRLKVYDNETRPLIDYFDKMGILKKVDGSGDIAGVTSRLMKIISEAAKP